jgi:hypothetical protein
MLLFYRLYKQKKQSRLFTVPHPSLDGWKNPSSV